MKYEPPGCEREFLLTSAGPPIDRAPIRLRVLLAMARGIQEVPSPGSALIYGHLFEVLVPSSTRHRHHHCHRHRHLAPTPFLVRARKGESTPKKRAPWNRGQRAHFNAQTPPKFIRQSERTRSAWQRLVPQPAQQQLRRPMQRG